MLLLQATAPVKLQVEEALNRGIGSFQELLLQQKETLQSLQQDYLSYKEHECVHPSVVMAKHANSPESKFRASFDTGIMRQVKMPCCVALQLFLFFT